MQDSLPSRCPVCQSQVLQRNTLLDFLQSRDTLPRSYRCENGHVFIVTSIAPDAAASDA